MLWVNLGLRAICPFDLFDCVDIACGLAWVWLLFGDVLVCFVVI